MGTPPPKNQRAAGEAQWVLLGEGESVLRAIEQSGRWKGWQSLGTPGRQ